MKKKNSGFTLVELIVVIVILAILIGVTIGGIYMYVGKARVNTDISNAATMEETMSLIQTDDDLRSATLGMNDSEVYTISWSGGEDNTKAGNITFSDGVSTSFIEKDGIITVADTTYTLSDRLSAVNAFANKVFTSGLPVSQTNGTFTLNVTASSGSVGAQTLFKDSSGEVVYPSNFGEVESGVDKNTVFAENLPDKISNDDQYNDPIINEYVAKIANALGVDLADFDAYGTLWHEVYDYVKSNYYCNESSGYWYKN